MLSIIGGAIGVAALIALALAIRPHNALNIRALGARLTAMTPGVVFAHPAKGIDSNGIPLYITRSYPPAERLLLRSAFGIDAPQRLYLSDSSNTAVLKYDTRWKRCRACYVDSYRIGFLSVRPPGQTWDDFENRVRHMRKRDFPPAANRIYNSLDDLDPRAKPAFVSLLDAGRRAGFRLAVRETYRTPPREALLFEEGHGRTFTITSMHSYGRAVDFIIDDGVLAHAATRADWIRFRRFVTIQAHGQFRLLGSVDHTWDWGHVELPAPDLGFHSIEDALAFAARCTSDSARSLAPAQAKLGGAASDPCVFVPRLPILRSAR